MSCRCSARHDGPDSRQRGTPLLGTCGGEERQSHIFASYRVERKVTDNWIVHLTVRHAGGPEPGLTRELAIPVEFDRPDPDPLGVEDIRACLSTFDGAVSHMKRRALRRETLRRAALQLADQIADTLEDAEGWHGEARQEAVRRHRPLISEAIAPTENDTREGAVQPTAEPNPNELPRTSGWTGRIKRTRGPLGEMITSEQIRAVKSKASARQILK